METKDASNITGKVSDTLLDLSADLKTIFEKQINCDLTLYVGDRIIKCHKAVLSARSKWLSFRIQQSHADGTSSIILTEDEQILDAILVYIYTGNLRLVESLKVPLLDLYEAVTQYGLDRFKKLLTRMIKTEEKPGLKETREFLWKAKITDIKSVGSVCHLKDFSLDGTDKWCLKIRPLCFSQAKYAFWIYVVRQSKNATGKIFHVVDLEINILDASGRKRRTFVSDHVFRKDGESKMTEHISLCKLLQNPKVFLPEHILTLSGQVTICSEDSTAQRMIFQISDQHEKGITNEIHALSYDMYNMLRAGKYTDIGIFTKGSAGHKIHSYILCTRSMIPITEISCIMDLDCFGSIVWRSFIYFLYTGQPRYLEEHMLEVYSTVCKLRLVDAKKKYSKLLANNIMESNVFQMMIEAVTYDDTELVFCVVSFITHNHNVIEHPLWPQFALKYPHWAKKVMQTARYKKS